MERKKQNLQIISIQRKVKTIDKNIPFSKAEKNVNYLGLHLVKMI